MLDAGADLGDPLLQAVLLDDAAPPCARRWHAGAFLALHIYTEFNSVRCASVLREAGADGNVRGRRSFPL